MPSKKSKKLQSQKTRAPSKTALSAILLVVFCTLITSSAQIFYKLGSGKMTTTAGLSTLLKTAVLNPNLWTGLILYGIGAIILIIALKKGELSILYPIIALSYVWVSLLSVRFLGEHMNSMKWFGVITIIVGVSLIGIGSQYSSSEKANKSPSKLMNKTKKKSRTHRRKK